MNLGRTFGFRSGWRWRWPYQGTLLGLVWLLGGLFGLVGLRSASANLPKIEAEKDKDATAQRSAKDYQPNLELLTQDGKKVRFYDDLVKGHIVLINTMFTSCVSICPPMTANLVKVQKLLQTRLKSALGKEVLMLSVSVDPEVDTPTVLKEYATRFQVGPGWYFLTGKKADVDAVLAKLGDAELDKNRHSGMLLIGSDAAHSFRKVFAMSDPNDIASAVEKLVIAPTPKPHVE